MSILDDLQKGNLYPSEQMVIEDETYHESEEQKANITAELEKMLDAKGKTLLDELDASYTHILSLVETESFKQGFRIAIRLIIDGLHN